MPHDVRNLSITIDVPFARAYDFAHRPENFPQWAAGMAKSLHHTDRGWVADAPQGEAIVTFSPPNDYGILDHQVALPDTPVIHIPLRLIPNGDDATEAVFTLFRQPGMDDAAFTRDQAAVTKDLATLKKVLER